MQSSFDTVPKMTAAKKKTEAFKAQLLKVDLEPSLSGKLSEEMLRISTYLNVTNARKSSRKGSRS